MNQYERMDRAKVTCRGCGYTWTKNCSLGFEAEKDFYENYRPECPKCTSTIWKIEEIIEIREPLREEEKELFSIAGVKLE